jgi:mRNA-degrading endonuclease RelE of RelBE toxin-antitoxin system
MITLKSFFEPEFQKFSKKLPPNIRKKAQKAFDNFRESDQSHFSRGLEFKRIQGYEALYSIRIDNNYRALGHRVGDIMYWQWIGTHDEYMRRIRG